jgi:hypothetical protein
MADLNVAAATLHAQNNAQAAALPPNAAAMPPAAQAAIGAPGLVRVALPPREEPRVKPRKAAASMQPARDQQGGASPLSTAPLANGHESALLVQPRRHDTGAVGSGAGEQPALTAEQQADADFAAGRYTSFARED